MQPSLLIAATALVLIVALGRQAIELRSSSHESRRASRHPLIVLVGSLLALMATYSLVRLIPNDLVMRWAVLAHIGFICFWLVLMAGAATRGSGAEE